MPSESWEIAVIFFIILFFLCIEFVLLCLLHIKYKDVFAYHQF
jgi:hypothetical protein